MSPERCPSPALPAGSAHGGVDGLAVLDGADGGTVAQVAVDDVELMERFAQRLGGLFGDEAVGGAVGAVTTDAILAIELVGQRVR